MFWVTERVMKWKYLIVVVFCFHLQTTKLYVFIFFFSLYLSASSSTFRKVCPSQHTSVPSQMSFLPSKPAFKWHFNKHIVTQVLRIIFLSLLFLHPAVLPFLGADTVQWLPTVPREIPDKRNELRWVLLRLAISMGFFPWGSSSLLYVRRETVVWIPHRMHKLGDI